MRQLIALLLCLLTITSFSQDEKVDLAVVNRIREEAFNHSQVANIAHQLTDVAGPRLTNSPGYRRAVNWSVSQLNSWGIKAQKEAWGEFGKGWDIEKCTVEMTAPYYHPIIAYPFAWSAGTNGQVTAPVVIISMKDSTAIQNGSLNVKGKIVVLGDTARTIPLTFTRPDAERFTDSLLMNLKEQFWFTREQLEPYLTMRDKEKAFYTLLEKRGAVAMVKSSNGNNGTVFADRSDPYHGKEHTQLPKLIISREDFLRIQRLMDSRVPVQLGLNIKNKFYTDDLEGYNVVGEIPGTDPVLKNELVMIGGHLDSWYSGTGATDNAAGSAVMMEVMRIIKTLNLRPKRTVRLVLWGGEEQGLLGSYGYVRKHLGDPSTLQLKPEQQKVSAYYNLDNGSGKIRGVFIQENDAVAPIFKKWLEPFNDLGASYINHHNTGATDHYTFDKVGIPGFQFIQDPLEYDTRTHHSNVDTYDHLSIEDMKQCAAIIASFVYHTAMRDKMLPRKPLDKAEKWLFAGF